VISAERYENVSDPVIRYVRGLRSPLVLWVDFLALVMSSAYPARDVALSLALLAAFLNGAFVLAPDRPPAFASPTLVCLIAAGLITAYYGTALNGLKPTSEQ